MLWTTKLARHERLSAGAAVRLQEAAPVLLWGEVLQDQEQTDCTKHWLKALDASGSYGRGGQCRDYFRPAFLATLWLFVRIAHLATLEGAHSSCKSVASPRYRPCKPIEPTFECHGYQVGQDRR